MNCVQFDYVVQRIQPQSKSSCVSEMAGRSGSQGLQERALIRVDWLPVVHIKFQVVPELGYGECREKATSLSGSIQMDLFREKTTRLSGWIQMDLSRLVIFAVG
jgi:hypothetical protein